MVRLEKSEAPLLAKLLTKLSPDGGARCIPVREFLAAQDPETDRQFFAGILLRNGVYKTTTPHRMDDLLPLIVKHGRSPMRVLDVACSSGVSTVELHQGLKAAGIEVQTFGTDLVLDADYVTREDGTAMLFDSSGALLQVEIGTWASPWQWRPRDRAFRPLLAARARRTVERELDAFLTARSMTRPRYKSQRVRLLTSAAQNGSGAAFEEEDVLEPRVSGTFDLIRAANLLNPSYFTNEQMRPMIAALVTRLVDGGLFLVTRTDGALNRATLFRRSGGKMLVLEQVNGGSEVAGLVAP